MKAGILLGILSFLSTSPIAAQDTDYSVGESFGQVARKIHDSAVDTSRNARVAGQHASDLFVSHLSVVGETLSGIATNIAAQVDLFAYDIRQGYEDNQ